MTQNEYNKEIEHIYSQFPSFQIVGSRAFKPGLDSMYRILNIMGNPHTKYRTVHIAGTNGKGSVSSMVASGLMKLTDKVGLYTSPHLLDFRERIKVNGEMIPKEYVYNFLIEYKDLFKEEKSSFFEITTAMAFKYFADINVDYAVIECGLGGRLDSTNVIIPELSIITNIGLDHCQFLGNTLNEIAFEKAGIIKPKIAAILGERGNLDKKYANKHNSSYDASAPIIHNSYNQIILNRALELDTVVLFADDIKGTLGHCNSLVHIYAERILDEIKRKNLDLKGNYQSKNINTAALALSYLVNFTELSERANNNNIYKQLAHAIENAAHTTGLRGRWEELMVKGNPQLSVVCDTGHNAHGFAALRSQINKTHKKLGGKLIMVFGVVADKDLNAISHLLPKDGIYIAVQAKGERALSSTILMEKLSSFGLECNYCYNTVNEGIKKAVEIADKSDFIYIGGSTFVVAEALECDFLETI